MQYLLFRSSVILIMVVGTSVPVATADETQHQGEKVFMMRPIGHIEKTGDRTLIVLDKKFQPGLLGLEEWSHVQVFWWFDKNDTPERRSILQVHPRGNP